MVLFASDCLAIRWRGGRVFRRRAIAITLTAGLAALFVRRGFFATGWLGGAFLRAVVLLVPLRFVAPTALAVPAVVSALAVAFVVAFSVAVPGIRALAILVTAVRVIFAIAIAVAATVVLVTALRAALAAFIAAAVAAGTLVVTTGYAGFSTILAALIAAILTLASALFAGLGLRFFLTAEEAGNLAAKAAEQAFFLINGFGSPGCRSGRGRTGTNRPYGCLFTNRFFRDRGFEDFLFTLAVFLGHLVAGDMLGRCFVVAHPDDFEVRCFHVRHGHHDDTHFLARLDICQLLALFVQKESGNRHGNNSPHFAGLVFRGLFVDQAHDAQGEGFNAPDGALAFATRANLAAGFSEGGAQALTGHLKQAKSRNLPDLNPRPVNFQGLTDLLFNFPLVPGGSHVDEIDDNQAAHVTQAQLAGDFLGRFQVGLEGGFLDVMALGGTGGVDVDGNQRFGWIDNN